MEVPFRVDVFFERVKKAANGQPGKIHLTVNRTLLCSKHSRTEWAQYDTERVSPTQFTTKDLGCDRCMGRLTGPLAQNA